MASLIFLEYREGVAGRVQGEGEGSAARRSDEKAQGGKADRGAQADLDPRGHYP